MIHHVPSPQLKSVRSPFSRPSGPSATANRARPGLGSLVAKIVPVVYICTLAGLTTAFLVGRLLPLSLLMTTAAFFHLSKVELLLQSMEGLDGERRLDRLLHNHSSRFLPFLTRHRYIALALAINVPGNFLIGGGGGIAMIAGLSRVITLPRFD